MNKPDLALNNPQKWICHKAKPNLIIRHTTRLITACAVTIDNQLG